jgi:hypothetical protein
MFATLKEFKAGKLSKRDTLSVVSKVIEGHHDLIQGLMGILYHGASAWAPEDFNLPQLHIAPRFLQPAHEPQMRLPSMSAPWESNQQPVLSIDPAVFGGYGGYERVEQPMRPESLFAQTGPGNWHSPTRNTPTSPMVQTSKQVHSPFRFTPVAGLMGHPPRYPSTGLEEAMSPPTCFPGSVPQQTYPSDPWGLSRMINSYRMPWTGVLQLARTIRDVQIR